MHTYRVRLHYAYNPTQSFETGFRTHKPLSDALAQWRQSFPQDVIESFNEVTP